MNTNNNSFAYEEARDEPANPSSVNTSVLNALIYEYLIKKNYTGTAKVFKIEGDIERINLSNGTSALMDWFVAFNDIYNIRCGRTGSAEIVSKIDAVMGRGREGKEGFVRYGGPSFSSGGSGAPPAPPLAEGRRPIPRSTSAEQVYRYRRDGDILNTILGITDDSYPNTPPSSLSSASGKTFHALEKEPSLPFLKEVAKIKLHSQKITAMSICRSKKILLTGGLDTFISVLDLSTLAPILKFEAHSMQITQIRTKESFPDAPTFFASASLAADVKLYKITEVDRSYEVSLVHSLVGHKNYVRAIEFIKTRIVTVGMDGEVIEWSLNGECISTCSLNRTIRMATAFTEDLMVIGDINSVFLYNPSLQSVVRELSSKGAFGFSKTKKDLVILHQDLAVRYNGAYSPIESIQLPTDKIQSVTTLFGKILLGGYQAIYLWMERKFSIIHAHDTIVTCLDTLDSSSLLISSSYDGEVKVWETSP